MPTITHSTCTCGNPACLVRIKRRLLPFCRMPRDTVVVPELGVQCSGIDSGIPCALREGHDGYCMSHRLVAHRNVSWVSQS
jgi:hypothetical protein